MVEKSVAAFATIDNKQINVFVNPSSENTAFKHAVSFLGTSNGVFRCFQTVERVMKLVIEALKGSGSAMVGYLEGLSSKFLIAWTSTSILRLPEVTSKAIKSINDFNEAALDASADFSRKSVKAVHDFFEMTTMWIYSGAFVAPALKPAGDIPDLISNATELQMNAEDWYLASKAVKNAAAQSSPVEVELALVHTQRNSLIKMLKAACSVSGAVLGFSVAIFGGPLISAAAAITISLAGTVLAMMSHFYQETSPYKMVDFFDSRSVQILSAVKI